MRSGYKEEQVLNKEARNLEEVLKYDIATH